MSGGTRRKRLVVIKICGITNWRDAADAIDCGADALGFNLFRGSRRFLEVQTAAEWIMQLPGAVRKVAVMVNPSLDQALHTAQAGLFDSLQLHGQESPDFCRGLAEHGVAFTKAVPVRDETSLDQPVVFSTTSILLDSAGPDGFGGTGHTFPWSLARGFIQSHPEFQVILAGGLTPENVGEAVATVRPFGIDVTSGVEAAVGHKDRSRLKAFISAARSA
jgi:phosphoribosylanthranilate isomerase